jgi:predicted GNAT family N-acyltransferase
MIRYSGFKSIPRGLAVDNALAKAKPSKPHYYLFAIGCRSTQRGKGNGGTLMQAGLERADVENMPAYLESSKESNVSFYQRFGFEVIEKIIPTKGCPPLWLMWRESR